MGISPGRTVSFREGNECNDPFETHLVNQQKPGLLIFFVQQSGGGGTPMGFIRCNNFHHVGFLYIVLREDVSKGLDLEQSEALTNTWRTLPWFLLKNPLRIGLWDPFPNAFLWFIHRGLLTTYRTLVTFCLVKDHGKMG